MSCLLPYIMSITIDSFLFVENEVYQALVLYWTLSLLENANYTTCFTLCYLSNLHILTCFRMLVEALLMTGSDLCASAKPWDLQMQTVEVIYDEFYRQVCKFCNLSSKHKNILTVRKVQHETSKLNLYTGRPRAWIWTYSCSNYEPFFWWTATTAPGRFTTART